MNELSGNHGNQLIFAISNLNLTKKKNKQQKHKIIYVLYLHMSFILEKRDSNNHNCIFIDFSTSIYVLNTTKIH